MSRLKALLWDVDGTLAETERDGHRVAFNQAFESFGLNWHWDEAHYGALLMVAGGRERLLHDMATRPDAPLRADDRAALAGAIHARKNAIYAEIAGGAGAAGSAGIPLRDGVLDLMQQCRDSGIHMGIATTTSKANVQALLRAHLGERWATWFAVLVCGEDVQRKKPDPEVYLNALQALGICPHEAVAIEDSLAGVAAARAAGIPVVVTRSAYFSDAVMDGVIAIGPGLHDRRGWQPVLREQSPFPGQVTLADIGLWMSHSAAGRTSTAR